MKLLLKVYIVGFVFVASTHLGIAQTVKPWPNGIPRSSRELLVDRLRQYVDFEREGQFDSQYNLFDKVTVLKTKDEYVAARRESQRLVDFEPRLITCSKSPTKCRIEGLAKLQWKNAMPLICGASLSASFQNHEWYLSEWSGADDCFDGIEKLITTTTPDPRGTSVIRKKHNQ